MRKSAANNQWNESCKICRLFLVKPELWVEVHNRVNREKQTRASVARWLNDTHLAALNEGKLPADDGYFKPFSEQNMGTHFTGSKPYWGVRDGTNNKKTGHAQEYYLVKRLAEKKGHYVNDVEQLSEVYKDNIMNENDWKDTDEFVVGLSKELMDYQNLSKMIDSLDKVLTTYNEKLQEKIENNVNISLLEVEQFQKQVSALFTLQVELTELRNKAPIAGEATKMGIEMTVSAFLSSLMVVVEDAKNNLMAELPNSGMPVEVSNMIMAHMRDAMKKAIPEIIKRVMHEYKIK